MFDDNGCLNKRYGVIVADCPWQYNDMKNNDPAMGGFRYPPMTLSKLANLAIKNIAKPDCALFMWATMPMLNEALYVISSWGFVYTTCAFVWVKLNKNGKAYTYPIVTDRDVLLENGVYSGLGHWQNSNVELCLFAKRGKPKRLQRNVKQVLFAPVGKHSSKPDEANERIERLIDDTDRIELFARKYREGWDATGLDLDGHYIEDVLPTDNASVGSYKTC